MIVDYAPSVLSTEVVSKEAREPQIAWQEAVWEPLWLDIVSTVTLVDTSLTVTVSVDPMLSRIL